jgi:hypothetical protein
MVLGMRRLDHLSILRRLVGSQHGDDLSRGRIECRPHVRLHRMPRRVDFKLVPIEDRGDGPLLSGIEVENPRQMLNRVVSFGGLRREERCRPDMPPHECAEGGIIATPARGE